MTSEEENIQLKICLKAVIKANDELKDKIREMLADRYDEPKNK